MEYLKGLPTTLRDNLLQNETSNDIIYCKIDGNEFSMFLNFFDVISKFFRSFFDVFFSMFCLSILCLFYIFAFLCFVVLCFVIDP